MRYPPISSERTQTEPGRLKKNNCPIEVKNFQSDLSKINYSLTRLY